MKIDYNSIVETIDNKAPSIQNIVTAKEAVDILVLNAPLNGPEFSSHPSILLPPFLWSTLIKMKDLSPPNILFQNLKTKSIVTNFF